MVVLCLAAAGLCAGGQESPELKRAREALARIQDLVAAGAAPQRQLREAEANFADAQDAEILHNTLYAQLSLEELNGKPGDDMLAAAQRRVARQTERLERTRQLVEAEALPRTGISQLEEELAGRKQVLEMARSRAQVAEELFAMAETQKATAQAQAEALQAEPHASPLMEHFEGEGVFSNGDLKQLVLAYEKQFSEPMPISARGETALHRALGFDHRGRIDVALNPDQPEGQWLRQYLTSHDIPYYAFRVALQGKATAPHIHVGPGSTRLKVAD